MPVLTGLEIRFISAARTLAVACGPPLILVCIITVVAASMRRRLTAAAMRFRPLRALLWLGVATHECGHLLGCLFTLTPVSQVKIQWHSGHVRHLKRGWLGEAVIAAGPIASSTLVSLLVSWLVFGPSFRAAARPFMVPQPSEAWLETAFHAFLHELSALVAGHWYVSIPALLVLGGMLSSAAPSAPDMRMAIPGIVLGVLGLLAIDVCARTAGLDGLASGLAPVLGPVSTVLGIATLACLLSLLVVAPLSLLG